jgi:hypothetical protein
MKRLLLACTFVSACFLLNLGHTTTSHVLTGQVGAPYTGEITVKLEGEPLPQNFQEVAIVQSVGTGSHANLEHVVQGLKEEAAKLGCNAVLRVKIDQGSSNASATGVAVILKP